MGKYTVIEREARKRRVYDLRKQGLSYRDIMSKLREEGWNISLHQIQLDLEATHGESKTEEFPFWCSESKDRNHLYPNCCFNHKIGLPARADGQASTIYDYQHDVFKLISDFTYLAIIKSRRIGITEIVLRSMLYYAIYGFMKGYKSIIIPGTKASLSEDHIVVLKNLLDHGGYWELVDEEKTKRDRLMFKDGTEIRAMPSNTSTVRGLTVKYVFMDEAALFNDVEQKEILNSVRPLIATTKGRITMVSTPKGRRGIFYSAVTADPTWHKIPMPWTVSRNKLLMDDFIEKEMKSVVLDFQQEYNCAFSTPENAVYPQSFIDKCIGDYELIEYAPNDWRLNEGIKKWIPDLNDPQRVKGRWINAYTEAIGGIDVAITKDFTSMVVLAKFEKQWKPLVVKTYPHITWESIIADVVKIAQEFNVTQFAVDTTAMGKSFADMVIGKHLAVEPVTFTNERKTDMINHCKKLLQAGELSLPKNGCQELLLQFSEQQRTDIGGGKMKYSHPETRNDDMLWAFHLACLMVGEKAEQVVMFL